MIMLRSSPALGTAWCCLVLFAAASPAGAVVLTERFDLPSSPLGLFGVQISIDFAVPADGIIGGEVVAARMHLELDTSVAPMLADAANLQVQLQPPVTGLPIWSVSGADLGWAGAGAFDGCAETREVNGCLLDFPPGSLTLWLVRIVSLDDANPLLGGQLTNSYVEVDILVPEPCLGDVDADGMVGFPDLTQLLGLWGPCAACPEDLDGNGAVGFGDLTTLLAAWGTCR